jgi:hypothetical protein
MSPAALSCPTLVRFMSLPKGYPVIKTAALLAPKDLAWPTGLHEPMHNVRIGAD